MKSWLHVWRRATENEEVKSWGISEEEISDMRKLERKRKTAGFPGLVKTSPGQGIQEERHTGGRWWVWYWMCQVEGEGSKAKWSWEDESRPEESYHPRSICQTHNRCSRVLSWINDSKKPSAPLNFSTVPTAWTLQTLPINHVCSEASGVPALQPPWKLCKKLPYKKLPAAIAHWCPKWWPETWGSESSPPLWVGPHPSLSS